MKKFQFCSPAIAFNSPAAAIMYRRGHVGAIRPSVFRRIDEEALFSLEPEEAVVNAALDQLRQADLPDGVDPGGAATFRAGPVVRGYDADQRMPRPTTDHDVRGQLKWDAEGGHVTIATPRARGIIGYMKRATPITLGDVEIQTDNIYGSILVVALDNKAIEKSKRILVQAMTEARPYGFETKGAKIVNLGGPPFNVKKIDARVGLPGTDFQRIVALDANGYVRRKMPDVTVREAANRLSITLEPDALYHLIER